MNCPYCSHPEDKVVDSRASQDGWVIRRRRECLDCEKRFTTYERIEELTLKVIKKDSRREDYDRHKILSGVMKACEKRPVSMDDIEKTVDGVEMELMKVYDREVESNNIGEVVMKKLHLLDEVAYIRFASVYRQFKDVNEFMSEVKNLLSPKNNK
ncbi:MAG: transcriptional regulator NrdR [Candidatus Ancaeobacter aquaticus]|nr:transcriptional regulator NrdR [Candidatus Ancaeobacter aquaticus]